MKILLSFIFTLLLAIQAESSTYKFMEENDLWKEDSFSKNSNITEEMFHRIIDAAFEIYKPVADANDDKLKFVRDWESSRVNASCYRGSTSVIIDLFGGLARRDEITPEGFMLVICHELGHAYGGEPYRTEWNRMSIEGQSDYYGTLVCAKKLFSKLSIPDNTLQPTNFMAESCEDYSGDPDLCVRILQAGQSVANLLARKDNKKPNYETPDKSKVKETNMSYPKPQCRLDTYFSGTFGLKRPACWYKHD